LLGSMDFDLDILGFDEQELSGLFDPLQEDNPELKEESYSQVFNIIVNCENEAHQERVYNELIEKGYECQVQSL
jgi:predicted 3-demethylubiquinone-9 3-methyltransferase (glyoxalase superfamily)